MKSRTVILLCMVLTAAGCNSKPAETKPAETQPAPQPAATNPINLVVAGTTNKFYTAVSSRQLKTADGAKVNIMRGKDGNIQGVTIIARDNEVSGRMTCQCGASSCFSNSNDACRMERQDETGWTSVWCVGGCTGDHQQPCGCGLAEDTTDGGSGSGASTRGPTQVIPPKFGGDKVPPSSNAGKPPASATGPDR